MISLKNKYEIFETNIKTRVIFGSGAFMNVGAEAKGFGKRALLVSASNALFHNGTLAKLQENLMRFGIKSKIAIGVSPNPKTDEINRICHYNKNKIDFVIGIGGGSSIDAAKASAVLLGSKEDSIEKYLLEGKRLPESTLPILAIPTTAGSGSEMTQAAILTDKKQMLKAGIRGRTIIPSLAIIDPFLSLSVPYEVTKFSGFDAFTHAFESFVSNKSNYFSEMLSKEAMAITMYALPRLLKDLNNLNLRSQMSFASMIGGINLVDVGTCLPHRLQYPIGALTDMPHGLGLAIIYPEWLEKIKKAKIKKIDQLDFLFKGLKKRNFNNPINGIEEFLNNLNMESHMIKRYRIKADVKSLLLKVRGAVDNDPVYSKAVIKQIYSALFKKVS